MNIAIITLGSRGDVQPFVALGKGLKKAGFEVTICTSSSFEEFITGHGLNYGYMNDEFVKFITTDIGRKTIDTTDNVVGWVKKTLELSKQFQPLQRQLLEEQWAATQNADLIIYHPKAMGGYHIAEKLGVLGVMSVPFPYCVPTKAFPYPIFPDLKLGGWYNQLTYAIARLMTLPYKGLVNRWRKEVLDLPPSPYPVGNLVRANGEPVPILHGYSPHVVPVPDDWPKTAIATGYWFLDTESHWQPPADLVEFLAAGSPPVYIGFGSISGSNPQRVTRIVLDALAQSGQRGIIAKGWGGLDASELPDTVIQVESIPHEWLFPQVAAVVHHGGAGTTAAGLRAGKPTIICPFFGDQFFWGRRVWKLGVGTQPIPQKTLTVERLANAISKATTDEQLCQKAVDLGEKIRAEDGVARAVEFIRKFI